VKQKKHIHSFKTPEKYFENFDEQLFAKMEEELLPKASGFKVPENYFDNLEDRIIIKVIASEIQQKTIPLFRNKRIIWGFAIAACIAVIFTVVRTNTTSNGFTTLEFPSIENYLDDENLDLDSYDLVELLNDEDITNLSNENKMFSEENIKNYLIENIDNANFLTE
jgi:hypothetical protein